MIDGICEIIIAIRKDMGYKKTKVKNYINDRKPSKESVKNLKVKILYVNHDYETRDGLSSSLLDLWANLFDHIGIEFDVKKDVVKQLDIK